MNNQKLEETDRLLRYMDFVKLMSIINGSSLYFSRADCFNDKYEGCYTELAYEISKSITIGLDGNPSNEGLVEDTKRIKRCAYISCWTKSTHESMAHWDIYGGNNSVAIISSVSQIKKQLIENCDHEIADKFMNRIIEPVVYIDHHSKDENLARELLSDSLTPLKKKNIAFRYEEEVRLIYSHHQHILAETDFNKKLGKGFKVGINCNNLIDKIVVSPKAAKWFYKQVKRNMVCYELSDKVEWSRLRYSPYEKIFN